MNWIDREQQVSRTSGDRTHLDISALFLGSCPLIHLIHLPKRKLWSRAVLLQPEQVEGVKFTNWKCPMKASKIFIKKRFYQTFISERPRSSIAARARPVPPIRWCAFKWQHWMAMWSTVASRNCRTSSTKILLRALWLPIYSSPSPASSQSSTWAQMLDVDDVDLKSSLLFQSKDWKYSQPCTPWTFSLTPKCLVGWRYRWTNTQNSRYERKCSYYEKTSH